VNPMKMKFYRGLAANADEPNTCARILAQGAIPEYILSDAWEYTFISCYTPGGRRAVMCVLETGATGNPGTTS
jgi:hypothetical protein